MLLKVTKDGAITLTQPAWATIIAGVALFSGWMTSMQYDVNGWKDVASKVDRIERILIYNHLDVPSDVSKAAKWPDSSSPLLSSPLLPSTPAVGIARPVSASETP